MNLQTFLAHLAVMYTQTPDKPELLVVVVIFQSMCTCVSKVEKKYPGICL